MTRVRELRDLGDQDLLERLESSKEELFNLRFQLATGQLDNPMRIKQVRHDVARILTVLREREIESSADEASVATPRRQPKPAARRSAGAATPPAPSPTTSSRPRRWPPGRRPPTPRAPTRRPSRRSAAA